MKRVRLELLPDFSDAAVVPAIQDALGAGCRVLVVCNTVQRANALLRLMEGAGIPASTQFSVRGVAVPHHGRFARADRELMDAAVTAQLGRSARSGPLLLVGTQTLEQSLDIDADFLVTDLAPIDVLLQRIGRLHRHQRHDRPTAFTQARVLVRCPHGLELESAIARDGTMNSQAGLGRVYPDGRILQRTLDVLQAQREIELPRDNRFLVEQATHPEALDSLAAPAWARHASHLLGKELVALRAATAGVVASSPFGELHWPAAEEAVLTRLGSDTLRIRLRRPMTLFPDNSVDEVPIPAHMLPAAGDFEDAVEPSVRCDGFEFTLGNRRYRYTRFGLERDDA